MSISLSSLSLRQSGRLPKVDFLKMWHPRPLFCSFLVFFKQTLQNLQQINEKNVRRVSGAGIRTLIMSLLLKHAEHCVKLWRFEIFKNGIQPNSPLKNIIKDSRHSNLYVPATEYECPKRSLVKQILPISPMCGAG